MRVQHFVFVLKEEVKLQTVTRQDSLVGNCPFWFGDYFCTGRLLPSPLGFAGILLWHCKGKDERRVQIMEEFYHRELLSWELV